MIIPIGIEGATLHRIPWASIAIALGCAAAFVATWILPSVPEDAGLDQCVAVVGYLEAHPYLKLPAGFGEACFGDELAAKIAAQRPLTTAPAAPMLALEQVQLEALVRHARDAMAANPMLRWALVAHRGALQPGWLSAQFLHLGWFHLLGNLFFFYLVGPLLEDAWGRLRFLAFYLLGGVVAFAAQVAFHPMGFVVGASGSIAACMGAFTLVYARERVRMGYLFIPFFRIIRGSFLLPAWLWGLSWIGFELYDLWSGESSGVAVMAHVAGFAFGFAVAILAKLAGGRSPEAARPQARRSPHRAELERARAAAERGDAAEAAQTFHGILQSDARDADAIYGLVKLDLANARAGPGLQRLDRLLRQLLSAGEEERVRAMIDELGVDFSAEAMSAATALQLAGSLERGPARYHELATELLEVACRSHDPTGARALLRAAELLIARREHGGQALERLQRARQIPGLEPILLDQIAALEPRARALAPDLQLESDEVRSPAPQPAGGPPRIASCRLRGIAPGTIALETAGRQADVPVARILAVAAALVQTPEQPPQLVTDLVTSWGEAGAGPSVFRLDGASLQLHEIFPGLAPREAYGRLLAHLLQQGARALPDRSSLERGAFPSYQGLAALDAALYQRK